MKSVARLVFCLILFSGAAQMGFCRGDKAIPQVVNYLGWVTNFDLTNISPIQTISNMTLSFFKNDGSAWNVQISMDGTVKTGTSFSLNLASRQTTRVSVTGGDLGQGYAVISDQETDTVYYSADFELGVSVFYTFSNQAGVADTVTITVSRPTGVVSAPVQIDTANGITSGFAILNRASAKKTIGIDLYRSDGTYYGSKTIDLDSNNQWSGYLNIGGTPLFPELTTFKGSMEIASDGPFVFMGLLQTKAAGVDNLQFSTLAPVDKESISKSTYMILIQHTSDADTATPVDFDGFVSDFYRARAKDRGNIGDTDDWSWDLLYGWTSPDTSSLYFQPVSGAGIASLGTKQADADFDNISLPYLKGLTYNTSTKIDLSGSLLKAYGTYAVRTDVGNYAKFRIVRIMSDLDLQSRPLTYLILEVLIFK